MTNKNDKDMPCPEKINHGVRRLAYSFVSSIVVGIMITTTAAEKVKEVIGPDNYTKCIVFISLFLPLLVNCIYNRIIRKRLKKQEDKVWSQIKPELDPDSLEKMPPEDRKMIEDKMDITKSKIQALKIIKQNQEEI